MGHLVLGYEPRQAIAELDARVVPILAQLAVNVWTMGKHGPYDPDRCAEPRRASVDGVPLAAR